MPAERLPDWDARLMRFLAARTGTSFAWGASDCATFAADAVRAMTGWDPIATIRGRWTSARGAARVARRGGGLEAWCTELFGAPGDPRWAQRGDVVLLDTAGGPALGIVAGGGLIAAQGGDGVVWVPVSAARATWPVGR